MDWFRIKLEVERKLYQELKLWKLQIFFAYVRSVSGGVSAPSFRCA